MTLFKPQRPTSVLGLSFDGSQLDGAVLKRTNGHVALRQTFSATLTLDPLTGDTELVGREIRNHLEKNEVRERRCVVCLPLNWVMSLQVKIPELAEEDIPGFLQIEAERGFHSGPESLAIVNSRFTAPNGEKFASIMAVSKHNLDQLENALRAAQLKPASFSIGTTALQPVGKSAIALVPAIGSAGLQINCDGGIAALRTIDGVHETEGAQKRLFADLLAREIRITLGQLPEAVRNDLKVVRVFGRSDLAQRMAADIAPRLATMNLQVERVERAATESWGKVLPPDAPASAAVALATRVLMDSATPFEFMPPKVNAFEQLTKRLKAGKLGPVGVTAAAVVLILLITLAVQVAIASHYESRWAKMEPNVKQLQDIQDNLKKYRPWFDESCRSLVVLRKLTEAFPRDGVVSAKSVEIRDQSNITCSGVARDKESFIKMFDKLSSSPGVTDVTVDQMQGDGPVQFTVNFQWDGGARAN
jgi:hypothetical protein